MSKFISPDSYDAVTIDGDACYNLNNALVINAIVTTKQAVAAYSNLLMLNIPSVGSYANVEYFEATEAGSAYSICDTIVKSTTSTKDGLTTYSIQPVAAMDAGKQFVVRGTVYLK